MSSNLTVSGITPSIYISMRERGIPPSSIRDEVARVGKDGLRGLISVMVGVIAFAVINSALSSLFGGNKWRPQNDDATIWIIHPDSTTPRPFPLYQGLRIARKHGWLIANASQVVPKRVVGRWEALTILLFGDRS